jgi:Beta-lactamase
MTHRGGFEEVANNIFAANISRYETNEKRLKTFIPERIFEPGEMPAYSNYGTALAGYIVQRVSGVPFNTYVEKNIFLPLGMTNSTFRQPLPQNMLAMMSKGYMTGSGPEKPFELVVVAPAGALSSTGADMGRFMIAHLNQGQFGQSRILRPETAALMHDSAIETAPGLNRMLLGFYETNLNGHRIISHGGDTILFHSYLHLFVNDGVGIFVSFNSAGNPDAESNPREILIRSFTDRYFPSALEPTKTVRLNAVRDAQLVSGHYSISRRSASSFLAITNFFATGSIYPVGNGALNANLTGTMEHFKHVGPMLWERERDGELLGAKVVNGRVTRIALNSTAGIFAGQPIPTWRSGAVMIPAFATSVFVLVLLALSWPAGALTRRYYGAPFSKTGKSVFLHRATRCAAVAIIAMLFVWFIFVSRASLLEYIPGAWIIVSSIVTAVICTLLIVVNAWQLKKSISDKSGFIGVFIWSVVLMSSLFITWLFWIGGLFAMSANY